MESPSTVGCSTEMVLSRAEVAALPPAERAELARMLAELNAAPNDPRARSRRRVFLIAIAIALVGLTVWTVGLGLTLPSQQTVRQWRTVWVGFDVAEIAAFSLTGWAAWNGRQVLIPAALISGALLLCDAWFDVVLSWNTSERWQSIASAALLELPLAATLWWVSRSLVLRTVQLARTNLGLIGPPPPLHRLALFGRMYEQTPASSTDQTASQPGNSGIDR